MPDPVHVSPPAFAVPPGLAVRTEPRDDTFVVSVLGEVDIATVGRLRAAADEALAAPAPQVLVDLGACLFLDSSALQVLITLSQSLVRAGRTLVLTPGPPQVQRIFEVSGLSDHFFRPAADG